MKPIKFFGFLALLFFVIFMESHFYAESKDCTSHGGAYVRSYGGYSCVVSK